MKHLGIMILCLFISANLFGLGKKVYVSQQFNGSSVGCGGITKSEYTKTITDLLVDMLKTLGFQTKKNPSTPTFAQIVSDEKAWDSNTGSDVFVMVYLAEENTPSASNGIRTYHTSANGKLLADSIRAALNRSLFYPTYYQSIEISSSTYTDPINYVEPDSTGVWAKLIEETTGRAAGIFPLFHNNTTAISPYFPGISEQDFICDQDDSADIIARGYLQGICHFFRGAPDYTSDCAVPIFFLHLEKTPATNPISAGQNVTVKFFLTNTGFATASEVKVGVEYDEYAFSPTELTFMLSQNGGTFSADTAAQNGNYPADQITSGSILELNDMAANVTKQISLTFQALTATTSTFIRFFVNNAGATPNLYYSKTSFDATPTAQFGSNGSNYNGELRMESEVSIEGQMDGGIDTGPDTGDTGHQDTGGFDYGNLDYGNDGPMDAGTTDSGWTPEGGNYIAKDSNALGCNLTNPLSLIGLLPILFFFLLSSLLFYRRK